MWRSDPRHEEGGIKGDGGNYGRDPKRIKPNNQMMISLWINKEN